MREPKGFAGWFNLVGATFKKKWSTASELFHSATRLAGSELGGRVGPKGMPWFGSSSVSHVHVYEILQGLSPPNRPHPSFFFFFENAFRRCALGTASH